jgi:imidazoleglycerol-phosphate dehydratase
MKWAVRPIFQTGKPLRYARGTVTAADRTQDARAQVRVAVDGSGTANVATGVSVLDHLLGLLAAYASFDLALEVAPGDAEEEVRAAGRAFGEALAGQLRAEGLRGHGSAVVPSAEALAHVALEVSDEPLLVSHVDLSGARLGGMATDVVAAFLQEFVDGARLTLHVRLIDGSDPHHVLEAIFKALGTALAQAGRPRRRKEEPHA